MKDNLQNNLKQDVDIRTIDGVFDFWNRVFKSNLPTTGGVILLIGGSASSLASSWRLFSLCLNKDYKLYESLHIIQPFSYKLKTLDCEKELARDAIKAMNSIPINETKTLQLDDLLQTVDDIPQNSALGIINPEVYFMEQLESDSRVDSITQWDGNTISLITPEECALNRLFSIIPKLINKAKDNSLFIILFVDIGIYGPEMIPDNLKNERELGIVQCGNPESPQIDIYAESMRLCKENGFTASIEFIKKQTLSPEKEAIFISSVYFSQGRFAEAWDTIRNHVEILLKGKNCLFLTQTAFCAGLLDKAEEFLRSCWLQPIKNIDELRVILMISKSLGVHDIFNECLSKIKSLYPDTQTTNALLIQHFLNKRQYNDALECARILEDTFFINIVLSKNSSRQICVEMTDDLHLTD